MKTTKLLCCANVSVHEQCQHLKHPESSRVNAPNRELVWERKLRNGQWPTKEK